MSETSENDRLRAPPAPANRVIKESLTMMFWSRLASGLRRTACRHKLPARRRALVFAAMVPLLLATSHVVIAKPWHDHGELAQAMARDAACAGAVQMLLGAAPLDIQEAVIGRLVTSGFRTVHGHEVVVTHGSSDDGTSAADFPLAVRISYRDEHYLLEDVIAYARSWAVTSVVVDEADIDECTLGPFTEA